MKSVLGIWQLLLYKFLADVINSYYQMPNRTDIFCIRLAIYTYNAEMLIIEIWGLGKLDSDFNHF